MAKKSLPAPKPGPVPEVLKLEGEWEDALKKALQRPKPPDAAVQPPVPLKKLRTKRR
jgi:hypothetical protein